MPELNWMPEHAADDDIGLESIVPEDVLYEYDGPRLFTVASDSGLYLCYLCDAGDTRFRFVVVPTSEKIVARLKDGLITAYESLDQPRVWLIDTGLSGEVERTVRTNLIEIDQRFLPKPTVMLHPDLEPVLTVKLQGQQMRAGAVPASVMKRAIDGAYGALKKLAEMVEGVQEAAGRPVRSIRTLYDLPAQRVAFASFEVAFGLPEAAQQELAIREDAAAKLQRMSIILADSLEWARTAGGQAQPADIGLDKLEVLDKLVPLRDGVTDLVQISGRFFPKRSIYTLDRTASLAVKAALLKARARDDVETLEGTPREFDKDKLSFILRNDGGADVAHCVLSEELADEAYEYYHNNVKAKVVVRRVKDRKPVEVLGISPAEA